MNKCHFIGIGGIGMSALAKILLSKKVKVSGSDLKETSLTHRLSEEGATIFVGHQERNIDSDATIIYSSGISKDNPEYLAALNQKCKLMHRSDLLKKLMDEFKTLAVAGTHGKTTTTSLLVAVLKEAKLDPSFAVGGYIPQFETNAALGTGDYFIAEADESDGTFLKYHSHGAIVTNIGDDHMDYFGAIETVVSAFKTFIDQVEKRDLLFWCGDDRRLKAMRPKGVSYGFDASNSLRAVEYRQCGWSSFFDVLYKGKRYNDVELALTGRHNTLNALAVFGLALQLGISEQVIRQAFVNFKGVSRRLEKKGVARSVNIYDDYAHHPEEIVSTLRGVRHAVEEKRVVAIFQPHRYSRTKQCLGQFGTAFRHADHLIVTDIYAAGEVEDPSVSSVDIVNEVRGKSRVSVEYVPRDELLDVVLEQLKPHDFVITLGAGDITAFGGDLLQQLETCPLKKLRVGLLYGGMSGEHEISLRSARFFEKNLNRELYDLEFFGITKEGCWLEKDEARQSLNQCQSLVGGAHIGGETLENILKCDVLLPVLHGPFGEDGTIQGFLEIIGRPYIGSCHRSSAIAMDKALSKRMVLLNGIATPHFLTCSLHDWKEDNQHVIDLVKQQLVFPVYVKPVHLGSTIGVQRVEKVKDLALAIDHAFQYDHKLIIENEIKGREIEFAVYGSDFIHVIPPAEIIKDRIVHDYESKYGANACGYAFNVDLPEDVIEEGMFLAEKAYEAIECSGLARIDFFLDKNNRYWFNEVNPMPGFTESSMYTKVLEAHQIPADQFIDRLICLGLQRARSQQSGCGVV